MDRESTTTTQALLDALRWLGYGALALAFALSLYWVWRTSGSHVEKGKVNIDFLWPTYTPQKVRYGEHLAEQYMKENPNVQVNLILTSDPYKKLQIMIAGRTTPDVMWMGIGWQQFGDALMPLDDLAAGDPDIRRETYLPGLWDAELWQGSLRGLPSSGQVGVLYYNKDLFDQAGVPYPSADWTWDDMVRTAKALTRDFDGDGVIDQYGLQLEQVYRYPFVVYAGQFADSEWRTARIDNPVVSAMLEHYRDLIYKDRVMPTPTASAELGMLPMFEAGRVAMHAASGYALESFRKVQFDWDVAMFPWFEFNGQRYRATGLWQEEFCILWNTDIPEEAWKFARWCAGKDMIRWAALDGHIVPGRVDVATSPEYLAPGKRPANMRAFIDSQSFAVPMTPHAWHVRIAAEFDPIWQDFMQSPESNPISAAEAAKRFNTALQRILDEYHAENEPLDAAEARP
ncbi:MAG: sugar ABC transporter substrate-binding protein [Candidatus Hydrogenedentes bacterium]|nr:sugar ABC transporter substrate-binding protein [Candidatus Hydrogenedentota bacterium]